MGAISSVVTVFSIIFALITPALLIGLYYQRKRDEGIKDVLRQPGNIIGLIIIVAIFSLFGWGVVQAII